MTKARLAYAALGLMALPIAAQAGDLCDGSQPGMAALCRVIDTECISYLDDPTSLRPDSLSDVPRAFRRYFEGELNTYVLGYRDTDLPRTVVVFMYDEPACELLIQGLEYADILPAWQAWRAGAGAGFVASSEMEPLSRVSMDRAYAASFLAAPRSDGRVTEITVNWNLNFEGLTRLRVAYQPLRDHTRDMMQVELK